MRKSKRSRAALTAGVAVFAIGAFVKAPPPRRKR